MFSQAGSSSSSSAAMTAPQRLKTPPIITTASSVIESCVLNWIEYRNWSEPANRPPATPVTNDASANAHIL